MQLTRLTELILPYAGLATAAAPPAVGPRLATIAVAPATVDPGRNDLAFGAQRLGSDRDYVVVLRDGAGATIDLTGITALSATLRAAEGGPALATLIPTILNPRGGVVQIDAPASAIAALAPGRYRVGLDYTDAAGRPIDGTGASDWWLEIVGGVGTQAAPSADLTVIKAEARLVRRRKKWLAAVGMDTSVGGGNLDVQDALIGAMEWLGAGLGDPGRVTDEDLAFVYAADRPTLLDIADLKLMEAILGNADEVTSSDNQRKKSASDFAKWVQAEIKAKRADLKSRYGYGLGKLTPGSIGLGFAATGCGEF